MIRIETEFKVNNYQIFTSSFYVNYSRKLICQGFSQTHGGGNYLYFHQGTRHESVRRAVWWSIFIGSL